MKFTIPKTVRVVFDSDGSAALLNCRTGMWHALNQTGGDAWRLLTSGLDFEAVVRTIASDFDIPEQTIEQDLQPVIEDLLRHKLLKQSKTEREDKP